MLFVLICSCFVLLQRTITTIPAASSECPVPTSLLTPPSHLHARPINRRCMHEAGVSRRVLSCVLRSCHPTGTCNGYGYCLGSGTCQCDGVRAGVNCQVCATDRCVLLRVSLVFLPRNFSCAALESFATCWLTHCRTVLFALQIQLP